MDHRVLQTKQPYMSHLHHAKGQKQSNVQHTSDFKSILDGYQIPKMTKHAKQRMVDRHITINHHEWQQITEKMIEAKHKGITDSLVLTKDAALIASTTNHTIVTAMNRQDIASKIFTNINGTILIDE